MIKAKNINYLKMKSYSYILLLLNLGLFLTQKSPIERKPLVKDLFTADPSAHVFEDKIYIYPSHDNDNANSYDMKDYHAYVMPDTETYPTDLGCVLKLEDIPWASEQLWAPDCVEKDGKYYFVFPAKDKQGMFRIGMALGDNPGGPFKPVQNFIQGTYSIDPCLFPDTDGSYYLTFGGLQGGQLDKYINNQYGQNNYEPQGNQEARMPKIALMKDNLLELAEDPRDLVLTDEYGNKLTGGDGNRRFFEAPWLFKKDDTYYFTYSTGGSHLLVYATSKDVYGPYKYRGVILTPVSGWTTHHSILEFNGQWYLFYHDAERSGGISTRRNIKFTSLEFKENGDIVTINGGG